jgi:hypothetical protein
MEVRLMGASVDTGQLAYYTLSENWLATFSNTLPLVGIGFGLSDTEALPGNWYRAAPWLDTDNSPGVSIVIGDSGTANGRSGEALSMDDNGGVVVEMTVVNVGKGTAAIGFSWLSAPSVGG